MPIIIQDPDANYDILNALGDHWMTSGTLSGDSRGSLGDPRDSIRRLQGTTGRSQGLNLEGTGGPLGGSRGPLGDPRDSIWRIQGDHWEINFEIHFGIKFGVNFGWQNSVPIMRNLIWEGPILGSISRQKSVRWISCDSLDFVGDLIIWGGSPYTTS